MANFLGCFLLFVSRCSSVVVSTKGSNKSDFGLISMKIEIAILV